LTLGIIWEYTKVVINDFLQIEVQLAEVALLAGCILAKINYQHVTGFYPKPA
jgi:hypothetical protein